MSERLLQPSEWVHLTDRVILKLTGSDRVRYLNGQVTNDVSTDLEGRSIGACICNIKGKVEFLVWITAVGDALYVDGQLDQRDDLIARLDRYLIADDCQIEDVTEEMTLIHHMDDQMGGIASTRTSTPGWDYLVSKQPSPPDDFRQDMEVDLSDFHRIQVYARIPSAPWEITGNEFPAELGIDQWAVDFHKGCYLGQEIISRIESVGKVKRRLIIGIARGPLKQLSKVRMADGSIGFVTRLIEENEEKNSVAICLMRTSLNEAETLKKWALELIEESS